MSLAELSTSAFGSAGDGPQGDERVPPQDVHAEQSVIGGMLLSKDAIADVVEGLKGTDFYRPAHELIYDAILDLYSRGEPADAITVADELAKRGDLQRIGGQAYLHQLIQAVPTAANAGYYAEIVRERGVLRRLVEAGTRIVQLGYQQGNGDVEDIVNAAQAEVYAVADKRGGEDYVVLGDVLEETLNEIEVAAGRDPSEMLGVPTGFIELDELTHGLHPGQMIVLAARPAVGKALALDTPLPTPTGWTTMGSVAVGDLLLDASGRPTVVTAATDVMEGRPCFEVEFSDGSVIVADAEHQWLTDTRASRKSFQAARDQRNRIRTQRTLPAVRTTAQIAATLHTETAERRLNHSVALASPLDLPDAELPLSPYVLGAWLGDGTTDQASITTADEQMILLLEAEGLDVRPTSAPMRYALSLPTTEVAPRNCVVCGVRFVPATSQVKSCGRSCGGRAKGTAVMPAPTCPDCGRRSSRFVRCKECHHDHGTVRALLRKVGVLGNKHIPSVYLRASERQRRALLAGLLDTDGTVTAGGCVQFTTTSERLRRDVYELIVSLGYRCGVSRKSVRGRSDASSTAYTLTFSSDEPVFALERKKIRHKELGLRKFQRRNSRFITDVRPIASVPVRCLTVDNEDHLFLAGVSMIPTHNSTMGLDIARTAAIKHKLATAIFSLEMSRSEITMRCLSAEAQIQLQDLRKGTIGDQGWQKLARIMGQISDSPLFIDDSPNMSLMEIRAKCRRLKQQHNLKLVVIDYLQLMSSGKKVESRQQEVSEFSRALKLLAKELEVPVIAISQLNRGPEQRTDKRPQMSDLRESGCLPAETRILRADTGAETTIGELVASGARDIEVWSLDESLRYRKRTMTHAFSTGVAPVFRLTLASGKTVRATENHPFLTYAGWSPLASLRTGDRVAVPRHVASPRQVSEWTEAEVAVAARSVVAQAAGPGDGRAVARDEVRHWLDFGRVEAGGVGIPAEVFSIDKELIALFVRLVWSGLGRVDRLSGPSLTTSSRPLADDLSRLLLRFGIQTRVSLVGSEWVLAVDGVDSQRRFLQEVGVLDADESVAALLAELRGTTASPVDGGVVDEVGEVLRGVMVPERELAVGAARHISGTALAAEAPSRSPLELVESTLWSAGLELSAVNDVFWDSVASVELDGVEEVYDATVLDSHNFIANGIAVHNSIEQDADMVILLHRERSPEAGREGEADVIVAKHRNGPTKDLVLAFQGHYSRFANMARDGF